MLLIAALGAVQHLPFYRIFVADQRAPRDGRHLEQVGHWDPLPSERRHYRPPAFHQQYYLLDR